MKKALKNLLLAAAAIFISASLVSCNTDTETETEYVNVYSYTDTIYGTISSKNYYTEYRFYGKSGTTYNVSVSSTYAVYMQAGSSPSGSDYFSETYYSSSESFTPSSSGYVYVRIRSASSYSNDHSLTVSNNNGEVSLSQYASGKAYSYSISKSGTISSSSDYIIYRFYAPSSYSYYVSWENGSGAEMSVSAGSSYSSPTDYFSSYTTSGQTISPSSSGYVYIKVKPYSSYYTGSFTLTVSSDYYNISLEEYSSNDITASGSVSIHSYSSTDVANDYKIVYLTSSSDTYYSLSTTSGTTYTVQWCDSNTKNNFLNTSSYSFTDGKITAYNSSLSQLNSTDASPLFTFTATGSTTYIGVKKYSSSTSNGYCAFYVYTN